MDRLTSLSAESRSDLFNETALKLGMSPFIAEKDFWVCWTLKKIFQDDDLSSLLMFKGGTSLSKVFKLISRFSEDIDLILDWNVVSGDNNPLEARSKTQQAIFNRTMNDDAKGFIADHLLAQLNHLLQPICDCQLDGDDGFVINVHYPAAFSDSYLRPVVRLEIGPLAAWLPFEQYAITPYSAEAFPDVFAAPLCAVSAIVAERTFWEKATILHHEAHRPVDSIQPPRYSRHYYDLAMMARTEVKNKALSDLPLLENVVAFKQQFYPRGWAQYDLAKVGTFRLLPEPYLIAVLQRDYAEMKQMIFGEYPSFDEIIETLSQLEAEINGEIIE